jgi:hypothetical protein
MSKVVLYMSADWGNAALLDSDWATLEQLVAPGVRVDVVEHQRGDTRRSRRPGPSAPPHLAGAAQAMDEIFSEPSKRHATPESS